MKAARASAAVIFTFRRGNKRSKSYRIKKISKTENVYKRGAKKTTQVFFTPLEISDALYLF